jgi:Histone deacetylase domain
VLEHEKFMFLLREQCPRAELEIIAQCHPWEYIERIRGAVPEVGLVQLNDDTVLSAGRFEASLRAAGGAILAVDEVMAARAKNAFVAIRPAGHHAATTTAMGFCLFNNAIAAVTRSDAMAPNARRLSISMPITATAPSKSSGVIGRSCIARLTRCRSFRVLGRSASAANTTTSSTRRCERATVEKHFARRRDRDSSQASRIRA